MSGFRPVRGSMSSQSIKKLLANPEDVSTKAPSAFRRPSDESKFSGTDQKPNNSKNIPEE
jgi:hypothetical protein